MMLKKTQTGPRQDDQDDDSLRGMKEEGAGAARRYLASAMVLLAGVAAASR